jgi:hypothetical protein
LTNLKNRNEKIEMSQVRDENFRARRQAEHGGSRFNFLLTVAVLAALSYAAYQFIPVVYQASQLKIFMQDTVDNAAITDKKAPWVEDQIRRSLKNYNVPPAALITVGNREARLEARVEYSVPIPLVVTTYQYKFDHTARSSTLMSGGG